MRPDGEMKLRWMDGFSYALLSRWRSANSEWMKETTCLPRKAKCSYLPFLTLTTREIIARQQQEQKHPKKKKQEKTDWQVRVASYRPPFETGIERHASTDAVLTDAHTEESNSSSERSAAISLRCRLCLHGLSAQQLCNFAFSSLTSTTGVFFRFSSTSIASFSSYFDWSFIKKSVLFLSWWFVHPCSVMVIVEW